MSSVPQTPKRAVLYVRVSTEEQYEKYGLAYRPLELTQRASPAPLRYMANVVRWLTWKE